MTDWLTLAQAVLMGVVEGVTEFLPVSSTGHLLLLGELLGFRGPPGKTFEVVIQFGAIAAVILVYWQRLWRVAVGLPTEVGARRFASAVIVAFLPAMLLGAAFHGVIKAHLFSPWVVAVMLVTGGLVMLWVDRLALRATITRIEAISPANAAKIGLFQCLALVPGVSRAGASIIGGLLLGLDRRTAAEFSFFLAIPTMLGAAVYDLYKNHHLLAADDVRLLLVGFTAAFVTALLVVRGMLDFVSRYGFAPFAWYRIALGSAALAWLALRA